MNRRLRRYGIGVWGLVVCLFAAAPPAEQAALDRITAPALRGDLTYLASDELLGRMTPSPGLDLAADFIANGLHKSGLSPAPDGTYFQADNMLRISIPHDGVQLTLQHAGESIDVPVSGLAVRSANGFDYASAPVRRLPMSGAIPAVTGQIVAGDASRWSDENLLSDLKAMRPGLILLLSRTVDARRDPPPTFLEQADGPHIPIIRVRDSAALRLLNAEGDLTVSVHVPQPRTESLTLRNVVGVLPGSDPVLSKQYVLVTAHYDHLGATRRGVFHGANDNASGTASIMEIGAALAALPQHPRRSIVFMAFFGEEEGLLGSYYYASHPLFPLKDTVANLNLEQMGRTDEKTGREVGSYAISGPSYSTLPAILAEGAKLEDVTTWVRKDADDFFDRSDNYAFAVHGVPAHTVAVAFEFPDYHAPGDTVDKIDFDNMAKVDRGIAAGVLRLANQTDPPKWSDSRAVAAWREAGK